MNIKATIIIIHFSNVDYTTDCIKSVLKAKCDYSYEIIIVDNANKKNDVLELKKRLPQNKNIRIKTNTSTNTGFSRGIQVGAQHAQYEHLVILDNDTLVEDYWLDRLLEKFSDPKIGIATSQIFSPDSPRKSILGGKMNMLGFSYSNTINKNDTTQNKDNHIFYGITAWAIKKDILETIKVDTNFQFFSDDADIGYKVKSLGLTVAPAIDSKVTHLKAGKDKAMKQEVVKFKVKICNRDYWVFSYLHLAPLHFVIFSLALLFFKIAFLPARISKGDKSITYDVIGFLAFIGLGDELHQRRKEREQLRKVSYWSLLKQYSWRLYVGTMIFK